MNFKKVHFRFPAWEGTLSMVLIMKGIRPIQVKANQPAHDIRNNRDVVRKYRGSP